MEEDGNMIQYLLPLSTAFHADVALGSLWYVLPLLAGPMISHLSSGRLSPRTEKRSSPKQEGMLYEGFGESLEVERDILETKARSKR